MGRKVNPIGYRLAVRRNWTSMWYARGARFRQQVLADAHARASIRERFAQAMISKIEIRRHQSNVRVLIHTARPGMVIGKKGEDIENLREKLKKVFGENEVRLDIEEVRQPEVNAQLIAMNITAQLEKRVAFRRAVRRAVSSATRLGVQGIKIICSGRLNGAEIARTERYSEGRVPLHTLRADIEYGFSAAHTTMGTVGVKVWVFKGETYQRTKRKPKETVLDPLDEAVAAAASSEQGGEAGDRPEEKAAPAAALAVPGEKAEEPAAAKPAAKRKPAKKAAAPAEGRGKGASAGKDEAKAKPAPAKAAAGKPEKKAAAKRKKDDVAGGKEEPAQESAAKKPAAKKAAAKKAAAKKAAARKKPAAKKAASRKTSGPADADKE
jgi:small subunit ribosomal protein S3